jgi:DNA primase
VSTEAVESWLTEAGCTNIKPSGENLISTCPFHENRTGRSFSMNVHTGQWICFTEYCAEQGGLLSFLIKACGWTYKKALRVAIRYGALQELEKDYDETEDYLPDYADRRKRATKELNGKIFPERYLALYDFCPEAMTKRGFSKSILREWEVGFDFETNRITFPVRNAAGALVGFTKRSTIPGDEPKYLHLNFKKSRFLYGEHRTRPAAARVVDVWVAEGQPDAIALAGMDPGVNALSTMGSKVSKTQIELARKYPYVVLAFDHDSSGKKATQTMGDGLLEVGHRGVFVATGWPEREPPDGEKWDPGLVLQYGTPEEKKRFISEKLPYDQWSLSGAF